MILQISYAYPKAKFSEDKGVYCLMSRHLTFLHILQEVEKFPD